VPFDAQIIHWPTLSAFTAYLQGVPRPRWCKGITNHNTYIPNETQWRGRASVESCMQTYIAKGWSAGPHLFLVAEAPNPADTGIWQLTPLTHIGVHAGACNADHLGVENVGDFDARPPSPAQYTLLLAVNRAILERWGMPPAQVNVHNECMSGRTCPGKYLTGAQIRASLNSAWTSPRIRTVKAGPRGAIAQQDRRPDAPTAGVWYPPGAWIACDDLTAGYWHAQDGIGFIPRGQVEE
jgi:hypothetical protein